MQRAIKGEYEDGFELHRYVWRNYRHALTEREKALHSAAMLELKVRHARSEHAAARLRGMPGYFVDADVGAIAEGGIGLFEQLCCERLLRDYSDEIHVNRCERCNRIVAFPIACACVWCGHHWYDRRAEMVDRAASTIYPKPRNA